MFKEFPEAQKKFGSFADVEVDSLAGNAALSAQCKVVADRFDAMIGQRCPVPRSYRLHGKEPQAPQRRSCSL